MNHRVRVRTKVYPSCPSDNKFSRHGIIYILLVLRMALLLKVRQNKEIDSCFFPPLQRSSTKKPIHCFLFTFFKLYIVFQVNQ